MTSNLDKHPGGPKTPEGKARSAMNALRHGLTGNTVVLNGEDPKLFEELLDNYLQEWRPATTFETDLVHEMAVCRWRIQRCWAMEGSMYDITVARNKQAIDSEFSQCSRDMQLTLAFMKLADESRSLLLLHRYETRLTRRLHQVMRELEHLQNQRKVEQASACDRRVEHASTCGNKNCQTNSTKPSQPPKPAPVITIFPAKPDLKPEKSPDKPKIPPDER